MRYVQLRAFHHVAVSGGFSRAADALRLTQPAISDQVRKLEAEYDVRLFNRDRKQVTLTPTGEALLEVTRRMFEMEEQALALLSETQAIKSGHLSLIVDSAHHVVNILEPFRRKYPGISVSVNGGNTDRVIDDLNSYTADIGVLGELPEGRDFEIIRLGTTPIVAFAARSNPTGGKQSISFADLAAQPLVMREPGSKTRAKFEQVARERGISLTISIEAEGREAVREIVASGNGVGIVSEAELGHDDRLAKIAISDADLTMDEALICLRERKESRLIRAFMDVARAAVGA